MALQVFASFIHPLPSKGEEEVAWTDRLLTVMRYLDEKSVATLLAISNLKFQRPSVYDHYLQCCIDNNVCHPFL